MRENQRLPHPPQARSHDRAGRSSLTAEAEAAFIDRFPFAILGFNATGAVTYANQQAAELFGEEPDALLKHSFADLAFIRVSDGRKLQDLRRWAGARSTNPRPQYIRLGQVPGYPTVGTRVTALPSPSPVEYAVTLWMPSSGESAEKALANILDSATDPVIVVDDDLVVTHVNHAAGEAFGLPAAPLTGSPFERILAAAPTEDDRRFILGEPEQPGRPRLRGHRVFRCRSADGMEFTAEGAVSHTKHQDRGLHTIILRDVSARVTELANVRREMGLLRAILDHTIAGIVAFDADGRAVAFNRRFLELFRYKENDVRVGMTRDDLVRLAVARGMYGTGDIDEIVHRRKSAWRGRTFDYDEVNLADGRILTIRRTRMPGGGTVVSFRDVTDRHRQAADLGDALERLEAASALQESILDALPSNILLLDQHGIIVAANESWRRFARESGLNETDSGVGSDYLEIARLTFAEPAESAADGIRDVLEGRRELFSFEYGCHTAEGPRWFIMQVAPVGGPRANGAVVMHMDVTERELAERQVEVSERRQRAIIESSGDAILALDAKGYVLSGNPAAATIFGCAEQELHGRHISALLPSFPFFQGAFDFAPTVPPVFRGEFMGARQDGGRFPADVVMAEVQEPDSEIYIVNVRDTTEQRTMQEQLVQASKLSTLGEMAAGMAHELNQPLSVMRMAADNALMRIERNLAQLDYLREVLDLISTQSEKMGNLILNLRTFARREESAHRQVFRPTEAVDAACQLLRGKLALDSVDVVLDLPETCRPVRGSGSQLEQVIINLLSNAHDAILESRRAKGSWTDDHIRIIARDEPHERVVRIGVSDTGGGIPPEILPKLFNPFFTTKGVGKGTGLGLSVSYGIIKGLGGTITAGNTEEGASFEITLPTCADLGEEDPEGFAALAGSPLLEGDKR